MATPRFPSGAFVKPDAASYAAALAAADRNAPGFAADVVESNAAGAWPILAPAFALLPADPPPDRAAGALAALRLFDWGLRNGGGEAAKLDFVSLPDAVGKSAKGVVGRREWRRREADLGRLIPAAGAAGYGGASRRTLALGDPRSTLR